MLEKKHKRRECARVDNVLNRRGARVSMVSFGPCSEVVQTERHESNSSTRDVSLSPLRDLSKESGGAHRTHTCFETSKNEGFTEGDIKG